MVKVTFFRSLLMSLMSCTFALAEDASTSGTGFLISSDGWFVSNAHVVEGCARVTVGKFGDAKEILKDAANDLAAVKIDSPLSLQPLKIRGTAPKLGEDVAALGYPLSGFLSDGVKITTGNVNSLVGLDNDTRYLQVSTPIQPGNSGGPLIDRRGLVLGINSAQLGANFTSKTGVLAQNVNFSVKTSLLELFLQSHSIVYGKAGEAEPELKTEELAARVSPSVTQILCFSSKPSVSETVLPTGPMPAPAPEKQAAIEPFFDTGQFVKMKGADVIGFDYATVKNVSADQCSFACQSDRACMATTYNSKARFCFLKNDAAVIVRNKGAIATVHRSKERTLLGAPMTIYPGRDMAGGDYREIQSAGFVNCVVECIKDKSCQAFSYVRKNGSCWLKDSISRSKKATGIDLGVIE